MRNRSPQKTAASHSADPLSESAINLLRAARDLPSNQVRVRLLIALPTTFVLLVSIILGILYWVVDSHFGSPGMPQASDYRMQDFSYDWLAVLIAGVVGSAAIGLALAFSITQPIRHIISLNQRIAGGDLRQKVSVSRTDEVGELSSSFNNMLDALNGFFESRNRFILESFSGGLITTDVNGTVTAINSAAERMLDIQAEKTAGRPLGLVFESAGMEELQALYKEVAWRKSGITGREVSVHIRGMLQRLNVNANPMRDRNGNVFGLILNFREVAELQKFYEQMKRADRLATMGTFATGLAHEVRNPLGAIKGTAQLLAEDVREMPRTAELARVIVKEVNRLDELVSEVQAYSQPGASKQPTDLVKLLADTVMLARNNPKTILREGVQILEDYEPLPLLQVSADKMSQACLNIIMNAIHATPANGTVRVSTSYRAGDALPVRLEIVNTGDPIPGSQLERIFEPFFTTKDSGSGLGLSIAYQVVAFHGGEINALNQDDGVAFVIRLPQDSHYG